MNERIKELVVESGNGQMRDGRLYPHIGIRFEEDWQRFALLIVRECVQFAYKEADHLEDEFERGRADDLRRWANVMKQHFGVKE